ncbi:MAG: hypothetical protein ACREEG_05525, partial [Phenylobacterium sp.]
MKLLSTIAAVAAVAAIGTSANAFELVTNGNFEATTYTQNTQFGGISGSTYVASQGVTGWTGAGGNALQFYYFGGTQTTVNPIERFGDANDVLNATTTNSIAGGNFVGMDGDQGDNVGTPNVQGSISQLINGLVVGEHYTLNFSWAAAQMANRLGATTEQLH